MAADASAPYNTGETHHWYIRSSYERLLLSISPLAPALCLGQLDDNSANTSRRPGHVGDLLSLSPSPRREHAGTGWHCGRIHGTRLLLD